MQHDKHVISKLDTEYLCICLPLDREKVINSQSHLMAHLKYCHYLLFNNGAELKNINKPRSEVIRVGLNRIQAQKRVWRQLKPIPRDQLRQMMKIVSLLHLGVPAVG